MNAPSGWSGGFDRDEALATIEHDVAAVLTVGEQVPLDSPVLTCPGWTLADLAFHVGSMFDMWAQIVEHRFELVRVVWTPRPEDAVVLEYFASRAAEAIRVLGEAPDHQPSWTFWGNHDVRAVRRRVVHELSIHRVDAQSTTGLEPAPITAAIAADGIDERLTLFTRVQPTGSVHVHCTDVDGEWLLTPGPEHATVTYEHAKGDAAVRGAASDLVLVLWNRKPLAAVEALGDATMVQRYLEQSRI